MDETFQLRDFFPTLPADRVQLRAFLEKHGLRYEPDIDHAACLVDASEEIVACGCCAGDILKCFAVDDALRGQNLLGGLVGALVSNRFAAGRSRLFVYTRPGNQELFLQCGFYPVAATAGVAMLENRPDGPARFAASVRQDAAAGKDVAAIVVNCNPFTRGHRHLVEHAAAHCGFLYVFVVQEDRSVFPFADRLRLVRAGTADLANVHVCPGDAYLISSATFPTYFLKKDDDAVLLQAELDLTLFAERIAPPLGIRRRFVGQEPTCIVTGKYNQTMRRLLPAHGVAVTEIPRQATGSGVVISASTVRECLAGRRPELDLRQLVPDTTYDYLTSPAAAPVIDKLRQGPGARA